MASYIQVPKHTRRSVGVHVHSHEIITDDAMSLEFRFAKWGYHTTNTNTNTTTKQ
jgi:hypothetical protein